MKLVERFILNSVSLHWTLSHPHIHMFSQNKATFEDAIVALAGAKVRLIKYMDIRLHLMKFGPTVQRDRETQRHLIFS